MMEQQNEEGVKVLQSGLFGFRWRDKVVFKHDNPKHVNDFAKWAKDKTTEEVYKRAAILENNEVKHLPRLFDTKNWTSSGNDWGRELKIKL